MTSSEGIFKLEPTYYELDEETARRAHEMNSFGEYHSDDGAYKATVDKAYKLADEAARRAPGEADYAYELADRFAREYAAWLNRGYKIEAMCPSVMISGASKFPTMKKERQNEARSRHYSEMGRLDGIVDRIKRIGDPHAPIKSGDQNAVDKLRAKLSAMQRQHDAMKKENVLARAEGKPAPHPGWELANSSKAMASTRRRIEALEDAKAAGTTETDAVIMGEHARVVENVDIMRLQIVFDGKPDEDVRDALKHGGFRWSPRNGAWQRQLTDNARYALNKLTEVDKA